MPTAIKIGGDLGFVDNLDHVLYVGPGGSDSNTGLDAGHRLATIAKAFTLFPQVYQKSCLLIATGNFTEPTVLTANIPKGIGPNATPFEIQCPFASVIASRASTSASSNTVTDSTLTRTTDDLKGFVLRLTSGAASGQRYQILSNTATIITCAPFAIPPSGGDTYMVEKYGATVTHQGAELTGDDSELILRGIQLVSAAAPWRVGAGLKQYFIGSVANLASSAMIADPGGTIACGGPLDDFFCGGYIHDGDSLSGLVADSGGLIEGYLSIKNTGVLILGRLFTTSIDATNCLIDVSGGRFENDAPGHIRTKGLILEAFSSGRILSLDISGCTGDGLTVREGSFAALSNVTGSSNTGYGINCTNDSRVQFVVGNTLTGGSGDIVVNGVSHSYGVLTGVSDITDISGGTTDGFEHALTVGNSSQAGGAVIDGTDDALAVRTALYAAGDYTGAAFTGRFATRAGTAILNRCAAGKSIRMDTGAIFPTTQGGASGSGPVSLRFRGLLGDSPIKPNVGNAADCIGMTMSPSVEWTQTFWEDFNFIGQDRTFASGEDCDNAIGLSLSGGGGNHVVKGIHGNGLFAKTSLIKLQGEAQYRVQDIKNSGSQIYNGVGTSSIIFANQVGNCEVDHVYDYGESGYAGTDNAGGSADNLIRIDPSSNATWKGTRFHARNLNCGARTSNLLYCYPTHGAATAQQIHVEQFYQQVTNGTFEVSNATHISLKRGHLDASATRNVMNLFSVAHATLSEVTSNASFEPTVTLDGGHLEVIDTPLKSSAGSPCGIFPASATAAMTCFVTTSGVRRIGRRAQAAIVQYTLTKWGATDNRVDQLGAGDAAWLAAGVADYTASANDYITQVEQDGQVVILKSDGATTLAPGDLLTASANGSFPGRVKKTTTAGDIYVAECTSTVAASANALVTCVWRRGIVGGIAGGSGYSAIKIAGGAALTARSTINFSAAFTGVDNSPVAAATNIDLATTGVAAASYITPSSITVNATGQLTAAVAGIITQTANKASLAGAAAAAQTTDWTVTSAAHTAQTTTVESPAVLYDLSATKTWATGALALQRFMYVKKPTIAFVGSSTVTDCATFSIEGSPVAGANATITNPWALYVAGSANTNCSRLPSLAIMATGSTPAFGTYGLEQWLDARVRASIYFQATGSIVNSFRIGNEASNLSSIIQNDVSPISFGTNVGTLTAANLTHFVLKSDGKKVGIGVANSSIPGDNIAATFHIVQAAYTGTPDPMLRFKGGAHTSGTASTELQDVVFDLARTVTWATGNISTQRAMYIKAPTYAFAAASNITTAATVAISGSPIAGTNCTFSGQTYALLVESGVSIFQGPLGATGGATFDASGTGAVSLQVGQAVVGSASQPTGLLVNAAGASSGITNPSTFRVVKFDLNFNGPMQFTTGAVGEMAWFEVAQPSPSFVGASTVTDAYTMKITGQPVAGTNATITNAWALGVTTGATKLQALSLFGSLTNKVSGNETTSASTGANGAVPAQVVGYLSFIDNSGTTRKIPYYAV